MILGLTDSVQKNQLFRASADGAAFGHPRLVSIPLRRVIDSIRHILDSAEPTQLRCGIFRTLQMLTGLALVKPVNICEK